MENLTKQSLYLLIELSPMAKNASKWKKGVKSYALDLIDSLPDDYNLNLSRYSSVLFPEFEKILLNGKKDWTAYSYGGCVEIYGKDIAQKLCTPTELKRTNYGNKNPNAYENWFDLQAKALMQAWRLIKRNVYNYYKMVNYNKTHIF